MTTILTQSSGSVATLLAPITGWEHWDTIKQVVRKEYAMTDQQFEKVLPEYQHFLGLIVAGYSHVGMYSEQVDKIWHSHILCTSLYEHFCQQVFGRLLHHIPNLDPSSDQDCTSPSPCASRCLSICKTPPPSCVTPPPTPPTPPSEDTGECAPQAKETASTKADFIQAYKRVYGTRPPAIWNVSTADGVSG